MKNSSKSEPTKNNVELVYLQRSGFMCIKNQAQAFSYDS